MASFLHLLARDLLQKKGSDFERLTVVFPNKRAALFLAKELSSLIDNPVWMPEIITLGEFIGRGTGLKQAEELSLIIKLYKAYRECSGVTESFDSFYFWGSMLLGDFDDIDKYRVEAKDVFSNLVAWQKIEQAFPYLTGEQEELIRGFWSSFRSEARGKEQQLFLQTWERLYPTYVRFKEKLLAEGLCYEGMGQRLFCEQLPRVATDAPLVFAGFNALNRCEKKIFAHFRDRGDTLFYWDYDQYYTAGDHHEAGTYLRENMQLFPNALGIEHFNNFRYNGKEIEYIALSSAIGQAKLLPSLFQEMQFPASNDLTDTAIVLCDEKLLTPVIHSIPEGIEKINITMGYPAQHTAIAALVSLIGELRHYLKREGETTYYYYKPVVALLNHKLIRESAPGTVEQLSRDIQARNSIYIPASLLRFNEIAEAIFDSSEENMMVYLVDILKKLLVRLSADTREAAAMEKEFLFILFTRVQQIKNHFEEEGIVPEDKLYLRMIGKILQGLTIPFSGEPLEGMQVMGLMETRMLDFKRLIVLSANEGVIPKGNHASSFIPYSLRKGFELPTPEHQDALFAYYFYRLLQRSTDIRLLYTDTTQGIATGEMSRFLYQMKYESGLPIRERYVHLPLSVQETPPISIPKEEKSLQILARYTRQEERGISPSALNTYMECRLRFYFRYIAAIREKEEVAEELDHRLLGEIFHKAIQTLYNTLPGKEVTTERIDALLKNELLVDSHIREAYANIYDDDVSRMMASGANELVLSVVRKYVRKVLAYDKTLTPFTIISMEKSYRMPMQVNTGNGVHTCYLGGNIDRVDRAQQGTRVIDYKTGADKTDFKTIDSLFDPGNKQRNKAAFQTLLYCMMYGHEHPEADPVLPGIYSTKLLFTPNYDYFLRCDGEPILRFSPYAPEFQEGLSQLLESLFSPHIPFDQTTNEEKCRTCSYNSICNRH